MTTAATTLTRLHWHRPEWPVAALTLAGWLALVAPVGADPTLLLTGRHPSGAGALIGHAAAMAAAMMAPLVLPHVRELAIASLWRRRYRAVAGYLTGYLGLWTVAGVAMMAVLHGGHARLEGVALVAGLGVVAVGVAGSAGHRRRLRRCSATRPLALTGWRADRDCLDEGARSGWRCLVTSCPVMLVAMAQGGLLTLAVGTAYLVGERRGLVRDQHLRPMTAVVTALAVLLALADVGPVGAGVTISPGHGDH